MVDSSARKPIRTRSKVEHNKLEDKTLLISKPKRNKLDDTDTIVYRSLNDFSDEILKYLVSFLPIKLAAQTCVLSKRWRYIWTFRPILEFDDESGKRGEKRKQFRNFVDKVLFHHDVATQIKRFSLKCNLDGDVPPIKRWITTAVRHNPKEFRLDLHGWRKGVDNLQHIFPQCLFNCEAIEILEIRTELQVQLPSQISLPHLKILTLKDVTFKNDRTTTLLFSSPALEKLVLDNCTWEEFTHNLIISASKLNSLTINEGSGTLKMVTISSPLLESFCYTGGFVTDYRFYNASSITKATLMITGLVDIKQIQVDHFNDVLRSLQSVECLKLTIGVLSPTTEPIFKYLANLEILPDSDLTGEQIAIILNNCPRLKTLRFPEGVISAAYKFDSLLSGNWKFKPLSHLKNISIGYFKGEWKEFTAVRILLSRSRTLQTMEITLAEDVANRKEIETSLAAISKGSETCNFIIK